MTFVIIKYLNICYVKHILHLYTFIFRFAELTATVFVQKSFQVRLFNNVVPTPFVPFAVAKYKCAGGVMITASHNPKEDNGYKVSNNFNIFSGRRFILVYYCLY